MVRRASPLVETGMLVVDSVVSSYFSLYIFSIRDFSSCVLTAVFQVPGGPAHNHLEPGDILIRMNGEVSMSLDACKAANDTFS